MGNDSGLWRSTDAIGETGPGVRGERCDSLSESEWEPGFTGRSGEPLQTGATPYTMMAGLGTNGTAGVNSSAGPTADWPEILGGEGGPVAIDPGNASNWYVNNGAGVSIYLATPPTGSIPGPFTPVVSVLTDQGAYSTKNADVVRDGFSMSAPAPFLVDPANDAQLLIGTCRVWRGPSDGIGWSASNAISPFWTDSPATMIVPATH